jgi:hypothetical protein
MMGQAMAEIEEAARAGDPRAQAMCNALCAPPDWMNRQITPGVNTPCEGLKPLALHSRDGNDAFLPGGVTTKVFSARPQKPFQGERPVAILIRSEAAQSANSVQMTSGIVVGTDPQMVEVSDMNIEMYQPTSFGVRMVMDPCPGGIDISARLTLTGPVIGVGQSLRVDFVIWGSSY